MSIDLWPPAPELRKDDLGFNFRGNNYLGHLIAPPESDGPRPLVLVIHNYQGLKFFDINVAEYLARLGYVGFAIDMYGDIVPAEERVWPEDHATNPEKTNAFQKKCFEGMVACDHDYEFFRALLQEWLMHGLAHETVDNTISASAIGYCFGGVAVLEGVRGGLDFAGVVSFHGLLQTGEDNSPDAWGVTRPALKKCANAYNTNTVVLIENGKDDHLVSDKSRQKFYQEMDEAGVQWMFHDYARTPHGFALPSTIGPPGHLHEDADRRSTMSMLSLFRELYPTVSQNKVSHNAAGTAIPV
ncbi:MAG: dienelactone hydrolase family protein [Pseudomonadales bacterium]|nr:dienelactone hydrolase family protein [Pseudomonadales bacterium]